MTSEARRLAIAFAWYRQNQWDRLLALSADRDQLEDTYEEWRKAAEARWSTLSGMGHEVQRVDIDVELLWSWCRAQGRPLDGKTRSEYAARCARTSFGGRSPG